MKFYRNYLIIQSKNWPFEHWATIFVAGQHSSASHGPHFLKEDKIALVETQTRVASVASFSRSK